MNRKKFSPVGQRAARRGFAVGAALLAAGLLAACAARPSAPVVTEDDLTAGSAAQQAIVLDAGNGKNYDYFWEAEHIDAMLEQYQSRLEEELRSLRGQISGSAADSAPSAFSVPGDAPSDPAELEEFLAGQLDKELEEMRVIMQEERALDPAVSAQEAANRAGRLFEELYGVDLTGKTLTMYCFVSDSNLQYHPGGGGQMRTIWHIEALEGAVSCNLDGTTSEVVVISYRLSPQESAEMQATPVPDCFVPGPDGTLETGRWDPDAPGYPDVVDALKERAAALLDGSPLTGGAAVTEVRAELREYDAERPNWLELTAVCDDGSAYRLNRYNVGGQFAEPYFSYDGGGYPLRTFNFFNDAYLQK